MKCDFTLKLLKNKHSDYTMVCVYINWIKVYFSTKLCLSEDREGYLIVKLLSYLLGILYLDQTDYNVLIKA